MATNPTGSRRWQADCRPCSGLMRELERREGRPRLDDFGNQRPRRKMLGDPRHLRRTPLRAKRQIDLLLRHLNRPPLRNMGGRVGEGRIPAPRRRAVETCQRRVPKGVPRAMLWWIESRMSPFLCPLPCLFRCGKLRSRDQFAERLEKRGAHLTHFLAKLGVTISSSYRKDRSFFCRAVSPLT